MDHAGLMKEKRETSWEHFYTSIYFQSGEERYVAQWMGFIMYSRDSKEFVGCDKRQAIYKSRHRTDLSCYIFYNLNLCYDWCHHVHARARARTHTHTHTHTHRRFDG